MPAKFCSFPISRSPAYVLLPINAREVLIIMVRGILNVYLKYENRLYYIVGFSSNSYMDITPWILNLLKKWIVQSVQGIWHHCFSSGQPFLMLVMKSWKNTSKHNDSLVLLKQNYDWLWGAYRQGRTILTNKDSGKLNVRLVYKIDDEGYWKKQKY